LPPAELARLFPWSQETDPLVAGLVEEMVSCWQRGERPLVEDFLARHPELATQPEAAVELIYEELCLRREFGLQLRSVEMLARFPQWRPQLEALPECPRLLEPGSMLRFPEVGEKVGEFRLVAELGHGAQGRVFLATQPALADRPVVLKLTPRTGREHLALARLQHTHIVPLYTMQDDPERDLRLLCMPYFGGAWLALVLEWLREKPAAQRTGADLVAVLARIERKMPLATPARCRQRELLGRLTWVEVICLLGACLADALQFAHERGLLHLDLKPGNILVTADAEPM